VPDAGSRAVVDELFVARIVTVSVALTQPKKLTSATSEAFGTPIATVSPTAAPVTLIVRSATELAAIDPKSSVAVADKTLVMIVPPPTRNVPDAVRLVSSKEPEALFAVVPTWRTPAAFLLIFVSRVAVESVELFEKAKLPAEDVATPCAAPAPACQPKEQCF